jgi:hypothetical protein
MDNWSGQAFTVWRKLIRRGWKGNLTPPSTTLMTEMRISSQFKRGRSLLLQYLRLMLSGTRYLSLKLLILSLELTNLANLFALAIAKKNRKQKWRKKRNENEFKWGRQEYQRDLLGKGILDLCF